MLKQKYFLADIFILSAEKQPIKLSWRKIEWLPEYVNMQKGIDSLCGFIRSNLMRDPFSNEVFIFMGRNKKQIKILRWDEDKFILYTVKLYNKKRFTPYYNPRKNNYYLEWKQICSLLFSI